MKEGLHREESGLKKCPRCSSINNNSNVFCTSCGSRLVFQQPIIEGIAEAFITLFSKSKPIYTPSQAVYSRLESRHYTSIVKYSFILLVMAAGVLFLELLLSEFTRRMLGILAISFAPPIAYLVWVVRTDRYEPEPKSLIVAMFGWGVISTLPAGVGNELFSLIVYDETLTANVGAPIIEESFKMFGILWLATSMKFRGEFNNQMDGLIYGFAAGMGFAATEDIFYFYDAFLSGGVPELTLIFLARDAMGGIIHGVFTGMTGRWLGLMRIRKDVVRKRDVLPGLLVAIFLHGLWNGTVETVVMPFILSIWFAIILRRYIREALRDELLWGYASGKAPI